MERAFGTGGNRFVRSIVHSLSVVPFDWHTVVSVRACFVSTTFFLASRNDPEIVRAGEHYAI